MTWVLGFQSHSEAQHMDHQVSGLFLRKHWAVTSALLEEAPSHTCSAPSPSTLALLVFLWSSPHILCDVYFLCVDGLPSPTVRWASPEIGVFQHRTPGLAQRWCSAGIWGNKWMLQTHPPDPQNAGFSLFSSLSSHGSCSFQSPQKGKWSLPQPWALWHYPRSPALPLCLSLSTPSPCLWDVSQGDHKGGSLWTLKAFRVSESRSRMAAWSSKARELPEKVYIATPYVTPRKQCQSRVQVSGLWVSVLSILNEEEKERHCHTRSAVSSDSRPHGFLWVWTINSKRKWEHGRTQNSGAAFERVKNKY